MAITLKSVREEIQAIIQDDKWQSGVNAPSFTGTGLNDMSAGGQYTGVAQEKKYKIAIQAATTLFSWSYSTDGGTTYTLGQSGITVAITPTTIEDGVTVTFAVATGHTNGDQWIFQVNKPLHSTYLLSMINDAQLEISDLVDIKRDLSSGTITTTTTPATYLYDMPTDFLKLSPSTYVHVTGYDPITQETREETNSRDADHTDTTTALSGPEAFFLEESQIGVYPLWAGTLQVKDYYAIPTALAADTDTINIVSDGIAGDRIVKNYIVATVCARIFYEWLDKPERGRIHSSNKKALFARIRRKYSYSSGGRFMTPAYPVRTGKSS